MVGNPEEVGRDGLEVVFPLPFPDDVGFPVDDVVLPPAFPDDDVENDDDGGADELPELALIDQGRCGQSGRPHGELPLVSDCGRLELSEPADSTGTHAGA